MRWRRKSAVRSFNRTARGDKFSTTDGHGLTQMGGGFATEGNDANEGSDSTGGNGVNREGTEAGGSTTDEHGLTQMGGGFSTAGTGGDTANKRSSALIC